MGHNMSLKGIFGQPRRLVTDATRRLCDAIKTHKSEVPTKFVLMNTAGNGNRDLREPILFSQRCVIGLFRLLLSPCKTLFEPFLSVWFCWECRNPVR